MKSLCRSLAFLLAELQLSLTYRASFLLSFLAEILQVFVMLSIWIAVFKERNTIAGFSYPMMLTYLLISQAINMTYSFRNDASRIIAWQIRQGTIAQQLLRPVNYFLARMTENIGQTMIQLCFSFGLLGLISLFLREFKGPSSFWHLMLFLLSMTAGYFIMFCVSYISGLSSFWLMNNWGVRNAKIAIVSFLSGALVPLDLLPDWLRRILDYLPFREIVYTPTMIYMGRYQTREIQQRLAFQILWALGFIALAWYLTRIAIKKVSVNGG